MKLKRFFALTVALFLASSSMVGAAGNDASYAAADEKFRDQEATAPFFANSVAYVIFPTIGKGGIGIGGAYGTGRAYKGGAYVGDVTMGQITFGFQLGGQAYSEIIFFKNNEVFTEFTGGDFEFGAEASAVALTAGAQASASTKGATASAGTSAENTDTSAANWYRGMAVFTLAKGGLMYQATIGGQAFDYTPVGQ